ncbi:ubiquitin carboxyl-terminal hydrolase 19-like isoform X2 [Ruditapes philippinarum]|uniref:ubiquitin carboxyl-terminal hydrolase 19-like isoform X2 n=1 Tax=Ruditapes philippinarum TaxID=129788 RepID=UPI00295A90E5|nr:ubiquitin carboxyl-terminal hydrolase 19-like isoform X2 [Ruditapes philippinarum]
MPSLPGSITENPVDMDSKKDDPAQQSKRKKELNNSRENQQAPKYDWSQTEDSVTMVLKIENITNELLRDSDVTFADSDVTVKLPDGRKWTWQLYGEIFREDSRVKVKKRKMSLHMKKKKSVTWSNLESLDQPTVEEPLPSPTESLEPASSPSVMSQYSDSQLPASSIAGTNLSEEPNVTTDDTRSDDVETENSDCPKKEEEPVVELQLIKHDFIEKDDVFIVHIYVKGVNKDNLSVMFDKRNFSVKFQSNHPQFLKLHSGATEDTKFCWQIKLRGEIIPENSKFKVNQSCIEITLAKSVFGRWGDLEALKRKETPPSSKSDNWMSVNSVSVKTDSSTDKERETMYSEMKQNIERDNLKDKPPDGGLTASPVQKPTCKVQPLNKQVEEREQVVRPPGFTGLDNLGNTCFMNGVLQCLVNTREFRDFFLEGKFQNDLNTDNVLGSGGKLAVCFAVLCKVLWSGKHFSYAPSKLKNLVAQKASQFTGFAQHDSQEFLAFLLDGLHEDLNRIKKKPYTETVEDGGRPDEVVANEAWDIHKKRNDSFIVDLFQGQYKSKLVCPACGKVSITFDPFLYLSLPLPKRQRLLPVTFMWKDPYRKPIRYMLKLSKEATVEGLKDALHRKTGVAPSNIRVFEAYKGRIHKMFVRGSSLSLVQANDCIIGCEVLSEDVAGEPVYEVAIVQRTLMPNQFPSKCSSCKKLCPEGSKLKRCTKCFKVGYCDQTCQKNHWMYHKGQCKTTPEPVGTPFILSVPESRATFSKVCQLMEAYSRYSVDVFQPPVKQDTTPKLSSRLSSSNLSNSSQSSGSQNSLDSQSSFSSSCTITAEQEQNLEDTDLSPDCDRLSIENVQSFTIGSDSALSGQTGLSVVSDTNQNCQTGVMEINKPVIGKAEKDSVNVTQKSDSGFSSMVDVHTQGGTNGSEGSRCATASGSDKGQEKEFTSPIKPVLGIQTGDTERSTPMFYIKPVNSDGVGLTGTDGERLDDKGEVPLNLTNKFFLSVDWKNNDKLPGYVLVQSKEMDFENDSSMMSASLEESHVTLEQCLELFTEPEILNPEEAWYCPQCKEHREATKQLSTWKLPHTLIIQLKRFSFRNFIWRDKIDKMVEFPTRGLDLSAFYVGSRPSNEPPPIYDLYGVVNHHGGILGGHYTAHVRCADLSPGVTSEVGWRLCDDSRVSTVSHEKNVVTRAAYLLFYRRREVFVPPPPVVSGESVEDDDEYQSASSEIEEVSELPGNIQEEGHARLVIDTSRDTEDSTCKDDIELVEADFREEKTVTEGEQVTVIASDEEDLGYTDMDSVD